MAEPANKIRLRPSLLDRLTDQHPERQHETTEDVVVTEAQLREQVRRDLTWLFNTTHFEAGSSLDLSRYPNVRSSIFNYGLSDLTGQTLSSIQAEELEQSVRQALSNYEPRLLPDSIQIAVRLGKNPFGAAALVVEIQAELHAEPLPLALHVRTEIDLESGRVTIGEATAAQGR
jgi:type VI secretion system protein ImpF